MIFEGQDIVGYNKAQMKAMRKEMQIVFQDPYSCLNPVWTSRASLRTL